MEIPLAGEAPRGNRAVVDDDEALDRAPASCLHARKRRWKEGSQKPSPQKSCMLEDRCAVVDGVVGRDLLGLTSWQAAARRRNNAGKRSPSSLPKRRDRCRSRLPLRPSGGDPLRGAVRASRQRGRTARSSAQRGCRGRAGCPRSIRTAPEFRPERNLVDFLIANGAGPAQQRITSVLPSRSFKAPSKAGTLEPVFHRNDDAELRLHQWPRSRRSVRRSAI